AYYDKYLDAARWEASRGTLECDLAAAREALAEKEGVIAEQSSALAEQSAEMKKLLKRIAQLERKP
ncbi:MAG: hypothetical protein LBF55_05375, partial [Prevotellaceae bacterium]|nr:hypothetical protein [Prevotellaceae bacterium]